MRSAAEIDDRKIDFGNLYIKFSVIENNRNVLRDDVIIEPRTFFDSHFRLACLGNHVVRNQKRDVAVFRVVNSKRFVFAVNRNGYRIDIVFASERNAAFKPYEITALIILRPSAYAFDGIIDVGNDDRHASVIEKNGYGFGDFVSADYGIFFNYYSVFRFLRRDVVCYE